MPADLVNKFQRMFQDLKVSEDLNAEFKEQMRHKGQLYPAEVVNIKIFHHGAWGRQSDKLVMAMPHEVDEYLPLVEDFYKGKHQGRKLTWQNNYANATVCSLHSAHTS